jgi:hypothetical protein
MALYPSDENLSQGTPVLVDGQGLRLEFGLKVPLRKKLVLRKLRSPKYASHARKAALGKSRKGSSPIRPMSRTYCASGSANEVSN